MDFLYAVAQLCLNGGRPEKAKPIADKMLDLYPNQRIGQDLLTHVDQISKRGTRLEPFGYKLISNHSIIDLERSPDVTKIVNMCRNSLGILQNA